VSHAIPPLGIACCVWVLVLVCLIKTHQAAPVYKHGITLLLGVLSAVVPTGFFAAQRINLHVPLECHKSLVEGEFLVLDRQLKPNHRESWLIQAEYSNTPCLPAQALLSLSIDKPENTPFPGLGQTFHAQLSLRALHVPLQLQGFDVHAHWMSKGVAGLAVLKTPPRTQPTTTTLPPSLWFSAAREHIAQRLHHALQGDAQLPLILAMVIGDQGLIDPESRTLYANTGIAHLVAISGLHITLFALITAMGVGGLWRQSAWLCLRVPAHFAGGVAGLVLAIVYALIAGWAAPAQRTVFMLTATLLGQLRNTNQSPWDTWCLALLLTMMGDPWSPLDYGFLLSFGAVAILIFSTHGRYDFNTRLPNWIRTPLMAQFAVTVGLLVPSALMFNQQSLVSPIVNALSIPWMSFVSTPLALMGGLLSQHWALALASKSLDVQRLWLDYFGGLDWVIWPIPDQPLWVICLAGLGCFMMLLPRCIVPKWPGCLLMLLLLWPAPRPKPGDFWLTAMDVGQGTALAIQTQHHVLIYDTGSAKNELADSGLRVVLPWLKAKGYTHIDSLWVSHADQDHAGGAKSVLNTVQVGQFVNSMPSDHPLNTLAHTQHIPVVPCHQHGNWQWEGVSFQTLPIPTLSGHTQANTDNNRSCVLRISNAHHSVLFTGDIETLSEALLLAQHGEQALRSTVLIAPHHGSKTSSSLPFLHAVSPSTVIIQAGWKNHYSHPHGDVLKRYREAGIHTLNTAELGAIELKLSNTTPEASWNNAATHRKRYWHLHKTQAEVR
jgi:competence protein ComEC